MEEQTTKPSSNPITWVVLIIVVLALLIGGYFLFFQEETTNTNTVVVTNTTVNENTNILVNTNIEIDTSNWQVYTNEKYGYEVKYPRDATYRELSHGGKSYPDDVSVIVDFEVENLGIRITAHQNSANATTLDELIEAKLAGGELDEYKQMSISGQTAWKKYTFLPTDSGSQSMGAGVTIIGEDYYYLITTGNQFTPEFTLEREKLYDTFVSTFELL